MTDGHLPCAAWMPARSGKEKQIAASLRASKTDPSVIASFLCVAICFYLCRLSKLQTATPLTQVCISIFDGIGARSDGPTVIAGFCVNNACDNDTYHNHKEIFTNKLLTHLFVLPKNLSDCQIFNCWNVSVHSTRRSKARQSDFSQKSLYD